MSGLRLRSLAPGVPSSAAAAQFWPARGGFGFLAVVTLAWLLSAVFAWPESVAGSPRETISLNGPWEFQRDGAAADNWKTVQVPSSFQSHEGTNFHGVGWYRKRLEHLAIPAGIRVLLQFQAAATEAEVWWNGQRLGSHLGGWTPFRFDVTAQIRQTPASATHELKVRLDEKPGHNTQGFLPVIAPHFGGIWQEVSLLLVPETYVQDLELLAHGDPDTATLRLQMPLAGTEPDSITNVLLRCRLRNSQEWTPLAPVAQRSGDVLSVHAAVAEPRLWSPAAPNLYEVEVTLLPPPPHRNGPTGAVETTVVSDCIRARAAFRKFEAFGPELRLNGQPINVRGLLNWGYSGPLVEPNPGEETWRRELELARSLGFNLMKFCLWVPPQRYLELADETGMLTWMEYPTWHPNLTEKFLTPLRREFREFFLYDRNHPSVVLRSLTCETGASAQLSVIRSLYESAHELIPGALVEDDSSWIGWNRVHDFYDDHPYGNNHTWLKTLAGFNEYILGHGIKPLVLGESISADTWLDRQALLEHFDNQRPWWVPTVLDDTGQWMERMRRLAGPGGLAQLRPDSLRYGLLMRKYQIEAYRRQVPYGGYVITVLRDFPSCSMGFLDYLDRPKWDPQEWAWQRDTICLLKTDKDRRSFTSGEPLNSSILLSHFGSQAIQNGRLEVKLVSDQNQVLRSMDQKDISQNAGTLAELAVVDWKLPEVTKPARVHIRAALGSPQREWLNEWPLWVVPAASPDSLRRVQVHSSVAPELARDLFPGCPDFTPGQPPHGEPPPLIVASRFDDDLVKALEAGGWVLMLPNGQSYSFPLVAHWFLRGAPYISDNLLAGRVPRDFFVELQHFDLASDVVPNLPQLDSWDPILLLWDTHDQPAVRTHGLVFETRAAKGRLLVSALRLNGSNNAAGHWLLGAMLDHLRDNLEPRHQLSPEVWTYLKARLHAEQTNLVSRTWRFKPDPKAEGLAQGWQSPDLASDRDWKDIEIGKWWESQGYPDLDGWAWYRLWVEVPAHWKEVFLSFEGVDDCYELYVNGRLAGRGGDLATRKDALSEKKSYDLTSYLKPGQRALIAVRVYDWYGAGGIFRPVTLGTLPLNPGLDLLK